MYSSLYLVVIAMVEVATAMLALSLPLSPAPLVVGLVTFAVYVGDRITDVDTDEAVDPNKADKCAFVRRHRSVLSVLSAASYGLAIAISVLGGPLALAITLLPGAFWVVYATDWLPTVGSYFKRLKDVLVVNSFIVALAWAIAVVLLPMAFAEAAITPAAIVVFVYFLVDTFVNTEIPNIADMEGDAAIGVSTLPVAFGVTRTRQLLYGVDVALVAFVGGAYVVGIISTALAVAVLVGLAYALVLASRIGRTTSYGRLSVAGEAKHLVVIAVYLALL
ncbi:4-hydroxybenzoate polyprenyltransferase [Halogranum gelatinilyticum]|uniref:4-hydroxybenzoate polyprenyltransferase n=1 Tax=Halogranum gelatinilyticum TaxID=660521 RepID=A0A1G9XCB8_9EURY|nr:UbiA family prenyltransferase [Halogranum gelatinilyticum]SDM94400.1 4-hydroxybenzoate polyprenyltransferase [Halogranum gelatinilyticum]